MTGPSSLRVFLKAPRIGEVKTRLAADVGADEAARLYRAMAEAEISATTPLASDDYEQVLCFAPADAREEIAAWFPGRKLEEQRGADLGERMAHALRAAFQGGAPRAAVIGTDVPSLTRRHVLEAYSALDEADLVLGPTPDGGYYLIGMKQLHGGVLVDMPWSTPEVLPRTLALADALGLRTTLLGELRDVDTLDDVLTCGNELEAFLGSRQRW